jgi:hypothetical protein
VTVALLLFCIWSEGSAKHFFGGSVVMTQFFGGPVVMTHFFGGPVVMPHLFGGPVRMTNFFGGPRSLVQNKSYFKAYYDRGLLRDKQLVSFHGPVTTMLSTPLIENDCFLPSKQILSLLKYYMINY